MQEQVLSGWGEGDQKAQIVVFQSLNLVMFRVV